MTTAVPLPTQVPVYREAVRQRGRTALVVVFVLVALLGVAGGVAISLGAGDAEGAGLSIFYAMIPLPFLWLVFWWLDRYEPEPRRYKFAGFVWGGVVAVAIALALEVWAADYWDLSDEATASFVAPLAEEPAKCLFLLLTFVRARRVVDGVLDGLIYAGIVGIGFAFVENIGYYASSYLGSPEIEIAGAEGVTTTFIVRGVFSPFAHPLFTAAFGIAIGLAVTRRSKVARVLIGALGLAASIGLHGLWNGSLSYGPDSGAGFVLAYLALGALLVGIGVLAIVVRVRQVRVLERSLSYVAERGWIHPAEIPYLSRFGYRKAARRYARGNHGKVAGQVVKRYQALATEMAFLHDALMSGRPKPNGVERTYALLDAMYALRPALRLPPALHPVVRHI
ncbi:MAG: PrsW family intrarane metalloprotease [Aeromicrobium sp.]|nr:PrsW family intrarane metalloprotease [Aeromicrobium sp.]